MFEVTRSHLGRCKISDGTLITLRLAIGQIAEAPLPRGPTGLILGVGTSVSVGAESPKDLREKVKDKPLGPADGSHLNNNEIWKFVDFTEVDPAFEDATYAGSDGIKYLVSSEVEPTIISRTLAYHDEVGNPLYWLRWADKTSIRLAK